MKVGAKALRFFDQIQTSHTELIIALAVGKAFAGQLFVAEPEIGDVGGAETQDVGEGAADFAEADVDAEFFEQFDEGLGAFGEHGTRAQTLTVQPMIGHHIHCAGTGTVADYV
jgi:hypothetical protein